MADRTGRLSAGIDWASRTHAICVVDQSGTIRVRSEIPNTGKTFTGLVKRLTRLQVAGVAIERCDGPLVEALLEAGPRVVVITPRQVKGLRSRYSGSGAKSDAGDAYLLADVPRTDGHRLRPLTQDSEATQVLRALSRTRQQLVEARVGLVNQLQAELERVFPARSACSPRRRAVRPAAPGTGRRIVPGRGSRARRARAGAAARHRHRPPRRTRTASRNRRTPRRTRRRAHLHQPAQGHGVRAAALLAEIGDDRARFPDEEALAALAGVAPVTRASGKLGTVGFRWAADKKLRNALIDFADASRHASPWAAKIYNDAVAHGKRHPHAVRNLARAWIRVIWRCWRDHTPYDPTKHRAAVRLQAA